MGSVLGTVHHVPVAHSGGEAVGMIGCERAPVRRCWRCHTPEDVAALRRLRDDGWPIVLVLPDGREVPA